MLRRLRTAPWVRAALVLALLLSVGASLGLHPEPRSGPVRGASAGVWAFRAGALPHECLACLAHGLALPSPPSISLASVSAAEAAVPLAPAPAVERLAGNDLSGRSPPAIS